MTLEQLEKEFDNKKLTTQRLPFDTDITFNTAILHSIFFENNVNKFDDRTKFINYLVAKGKC